MPNNLRNHVWQIVYYIYCNMGFLIILVGELLVMLQSEKAIEFFFIRFDIEYSEVTVKLGR